MKDHLAAAIGAALVASLALPAQAADIITEWSSVKAPAAPEVKTVTVDPKTTALLMLDFIPSFYCSAEPRGAATLPPIMCFRPAARPHDMTVIYSVAGKFAAKDILADVAPIGTEPVVKSKADKFVNTDLEKILKDKGIQTVIVNGTAANGAVLYTGTGAALRGMKVIVPVDGLSSEALYAEQLTVWQLANGPGFGKMVTLTRSDMIKF